MKNHQKGNVLPTVMIFIVVVSLISIGLFSITITASNQAIKKQREELAYYQLENKLYEFLNFYTMNIKTTTEERWYDYNDTFSIENNSSYLYQITVQYENDLYLIIITDNSEKREVTTTIDFTKSIYEIKTWGRTK